MRHQGAGRALVRRVLWAEENGPIPKGNVIAATCGCKRCLGHLEAVTVARARAIAAQHGVYRNPSKHRRATMTTRAKSSISEETVALIRASDDHKEAHRQTGVSLSHCYAIMKGTARAPLASPFAGLGARP
jgi:hypothetical protein